MSMQIAHAKSVVAAQRPAARRFATGLSGRLLLLTVGFVLLAQVLLFAPYAVNVRRFWLEGRMQAARLSLLAVEAAPDRAVNDAIATGLLADGRVLAVAVKRGDIRELVLNVAPPDAIATTTVDMRSESWAQGLARSMGALAPSSGEIYMRVLDHPDRAGGEFVEALVPHSALAAGMRSRAAYFFTTSLTLSLIVGALIYVTLTFALVRPIRRLTASMAAFGAAPERPAPPPMARAPRRDELGEAQTALAELQRDVGQTLRRKQRLAQLGEASARINHELRNALASASLVTERMSAEEDPRVRQMGARLMRSINRAARLCEATLGYGGAGDTQPDPRVLALRQAMEDAAQDCGVDDMVWRNQIGTGSRVRCDPEHLHRIALNLMRNACAVMRGRPCAVLSVTAERRGEIVRIRIIDTGPGVRDEARDCLFQPFVAAGAAGGAGLGLPIARDLARANGGELRLSRSDEAGAEFEIDLPAA